jgi:hypothetical protein
VNGGLIQVTRNPNYPSATWGEYFPADRSVVMMVDMQTVQLKRTPFHGSSIINPRPWQTYSPPFSFTVGDLFRRDVIFLVWLQKVTNSGTCFFNTPKL